MNRGRTMNRIPLNRHTIGFTLIGAAFLLAPLVLSNYQVNLLGRFLTYAMVALGLDMLWGYTGMLSLGQGLFFSLGAYCFAMFMTLETAGSGLPEFMGLYGVTDLPFWWKPFYSPVFAIIAAVIVPMVLAGGLGYMIFRSRIQGVYFSIITQAVTAIFALLLIGQQQVINGTNGLTVRTMFGMRLADDGVKIGLYIATVIALGAVYLICRAVIRSRFGRLMIAVRDDENRVRFIGYNPVMVKTLVFMLSAGIAGIAGVLLVPQLGIISPKQLDIGASIEIVIWVAVGGRGTLVGAILGAVLVNTGKSTISTQYPDLWQLIMGSLFVGVVLLFPKGIIGAVGDLVARVTPRRSKAAAEPEPTLAIETAMD